VELGFRRDVVSNYATSSYMPSQKELRSKWVIKRGNTYTEVDFPPSEALLALAANNPDEQAARDRIMAQYEDPIEGLAAFAKLYAAAKRQGTPMSEIETAPVDRRTQLQAV
jgi:hypothetical protein